MNISDELMFRPRVAGRERDIQVPCGHAMSHGDAEAEAAVTTVDGESRSSVIDVPLERATAVATVRQQITTALHGLGEAHLYDVLLVVTELVNNVFDHTPGAGRLRVRRTHMPCKVSIEVDDTSALQPVRGRSRLGDSRGRGIVVVDNIADEWGTQMLADGGKTVFATISCDGQDPFGQACRHDTW